MSLRKKQMSQNSDWINAIENIEASVSREEINALTSKAVADIQEVTAGKKAAYAWSGGKDSIVLAKICEMAGITGCMAAVCNLEYPAFLAWLNENKPACCEIINTGQDLAWLSKHPQMLFPKDSATAAHWFAIVQHKAQREYCKHQNIDILMLGRRRADGNYVGRKSNIYTDGKGITRYSPLADWSHEHILAFIHYHQLELPPIYGWKNGYTCGTHPWPARPGTETEENGWAEVYNIDPTIVITAADHLPGAKAYMEVVGK